MNVEDAKWLVGTGIAAIGVWLQYRRLSGKRPGRTPERALPPSNDTLRDRSQNRPIPGASRSGLHDLQAALKVADSMVDWRAADERRHEIIRMAVARGELDYALEVVKHLTDWRLADECKQMIIDAYHGR